MKSKGYLIIFFLFLGGIITILFPPFLSLAGEVDTSTEVLSFDAPTGLIADVASPYQIDLSWFPAVKAVSYKVYRDGVAVGFPTATSFSDTGLTSLTAYTYTVSAVNIYGGESPQSSSASATTLAVGAVFISPTPPEPKSLIINDGDVYTNSVKVTLSLSAENAFQMAISNTTDFAGISWEPYQTTKKWTLTKGDGKKTIYTKFRSSAGGVSQVISDSIILDTTPPANISDFTAVPADSQITFKWKNPPEPDFKAVKIFRSSKFYPASPEEGVLIYEGKGTSFVDTGLINGMRYYYTAFAYDKIGNYASGAIVSAIPFKIKPPPPPPPEEITTEEECMEAGYYWYDDACHAEPEVVPPLPPEIEKLTLKDFDFWQEGKKLPLIEEEKLKVKTEKSLTISIDYEKVPEALKTIMVTLEKYGKIFSFLLKINLEKTFFETIILPPEEAGIYPLTLTILDYKNQTIKKISGKLIVEKPEIITPEVSAPCYQKIIFWYEKINSALSNWFQSIWQSIKNLLIFF